MSGVEAPFNEFVVGAVNGGLVMLRPPIGIMTEDQALGLAAWLVAITGQRERFEAILDAVEKT